MAKFKFRLDVLLKIAKNKEEEVKKELAIWKKMRLEALKKIELTDEKIDEHMIQKSKNNKIDQIMVYEAYLQKLRDDKTRILEEIDFFQKKIDEYIIKINEAMRERKILEKLKEKKHEQYTRELEIIEQKELDEIGLKIFVDGR